MSQDRIPKIHPLENPFIWFLVQVAEVVAATALLSLVLPDDLPLAVGLTLFVALVAGLTGLNVAIRRRFIPH